MEKFELQRNSQRTGVSTFANPESPSTYHSLQKSFHISIPVERIQNIFSCPSKKFKTPDTQTNTTKTIQRNNDHGLQTRRTKMPVTNSGFASCRLKCLNSSVVFQFNYSAGLTVLCPEVPHESRQPIVALHCLLVFKPSFIKKPFLWILI